MKRKLLQMNTIYLIAQYIKASAYAGIIDKITSLNETRKSRVNRSSTLQGISSTSLSNNLGNRMNEFDKTCKKLNLKELASCNEKARYLFFVGINLKIAGIGTPKMKVNFLRNRALFIDKLIVSFTLIQKAYFVLFFQDISVNLFIHLQKKSEIEGLIN
jgi:hypothetical protein